MRSSIYSDCVTVPFSHFPYEHCLKKTWIGNKVACLELSVRFQCKGHYIWPYALHFLLSQVAVHSFVENLFRTIWGTANLKAPPAIKYFFDFLDAQGESKRINDPDVLHIWKSNMYVFIWVIFIRSHHSKTFCNGKLIWAFYWTSSSSPSIFQCFLPFGA